jgi:hypothetical protein
MSRLRVLMTTRNEELMITGEMAKSVLGQILHLEWEQVRAINRGDVRGALASMIWACGSPRRVRLASRLRLRMADRPCYDAI